MTLLDATPVGDLRSPFTVRDRAHRLAGAFIASYTSPRTQEGYRSDLKTWFDFLDQYAPDDDPIEDVRRYHVDAYARWLTENGKAPATVSRRISVAGSFYRYLLIDEIITKNPAEHVRRPKVSRESTREWMTRQEMQRTLELAERDGGYPYALLCLLAYNALRISEACGANVEDLGTDRHHDTLRIVGKGNKPDLIVITAPTMRAINQALKGRTEGPLLLTRYGTRMNRESAGRVCRRYALKAGIAKNITPHSYRHSSITAIVKASNGNAEAARQFARHTDLSTTQRYVRSANKLDAHGAYLVTHYLAGGD